MNAEAVVIELIIVEPVTIHICGLSNFQLVRPVSSNQINATYAFIYFLQRKRLYEYLFLGAFERDLISGIGLHQYLLT